MDPNAPTWAQYGLQNLFPAASPRLVGPSGGTPWDPWEPGPKAPLLGGPRVPEYSKNLETGYARTNPEKKELTSAPRMEAPTRE